MRVDVPAGTRFGRLVVIEEAPIHRGPNGHVARKMLCQCDCGKTTTVWLQSIRYGTTTSCGCAKRDLSGPRTHGQTGTDEHRIWKGIIQRCTNPAIRNFHNYGGRGVTVCERWRESFEAFLEDMGPRPSPKHSIDRLDNAQGYCKENCRWATSKEQARHTRSNVLLTIGDETLCVAAWAERRGVNPKLIYKRLRLGWKPIDAVMAPAGVRRSV